MLINITIFKVCTPSKKNFGQLGNHDTSSSPTTPPCPGFGQHWPLPAVVIGIWWVIYVTCHLRSNGWPVW